MRWQVVVVIGLVGSSLAGCGGSSRSDSMPPVDMPMLAAARQDIQRSDPSALVGFVTEALPKERLVAVGELPVNQFRVGQVVMFVDVNQKRLTSGVVKRITTDELHIQYQPPPKDGRAPRMGDLAVRFPPTK